MQSDEPASNRLEPPQQSNRHRYIDVDKLELEQIEQVEQYFARVFQRPGALDSDPQVGDVVNTFIEWVNPDGELVVERIPVRVLWPRETYVRGLALHSGTLRMEMDVPRSAIAGVLHLTR